MAFISHIQWEVSHLIVNHHVELRTDLAGDVDHFSVRHTKLHRKPVGEKIADAFLPRRAFRPPMVDDATLAECSSQLVDRSFKSRVE
ncbi:hypothetical protein D3C71_1881540 [compost metagenome]